METCPLPLPVEKGPWTQKAFTAQQVKAKLLEVPLEDRTTLRSVAEKTEIKLATLHRYLRLGLFRAHSSSIRPMLTDANKYARLAYAAKMVSPDMSMDAMMDCVHLDEKWFYITRVTRKFYLVPGEKGPDRNAVARPLYIDHTDQWCDGKIGMWPFTKVVSAVRSIVNRRAGTLETKSINVTKDVYRAFLVDLVLPAIVSKWPELPSSTFYAALDVYASRGWNFSLVAHPPNSPDTNILDLGFCAANIPKPTTPFVSPLDRHLVSNVGCAFEKYPLEQLDQSFMTIQACLIEIMRDGEDNTYKIPHQSKDKLARKGRLPMNAVCPADVYDAAKSKLDGADAVAMEHKISEEVREARAMIELTRVLEGMDLDDNDLFNALQDLGIEPICIDDE
ncbi:Aste57867_23839 [Aphanomyces stellatus]|uniref:Aste57867_23839 protein n=1 Tax=Aphanomyces stellatus TaxID=120398 RepID=A0A485LNV9_9STRA|nr:hypothetical protein As57867_023766 [Aphanomyces stellatus]VFU00482.1 Aste57867_23839 [Aphanomyces stellatus]